MVSITNKDQNTFNNRIDTVFNLSGVFFFFLHFFFFFAIAAYAGGRVREIKNFVDNFYAIHIIRNV